MKTKHQQLIKLLYKNDETIDKIYKSSNAVNFSNVSHDLIAEGIVLELGNIVNLNPYYRQFVNTILLKADYSILFGNFDEHSKEILSLKKRYLEFNKYGFIERIKKLIYDLYTSIVLQDKNIESLLYDLENQISIELDELIVESELILEKVEKYLTSIKRILKDLDSDLASIHIEVENVIDEINGSIEPFIAKIESYCTKFSEVIRISEEKKALNQKLFSLSASILQGNEDYLIDYLVDNQHEMIFNVNEKIIVFPYYENCLNKMLLKTKASLIFPPTKTKTNIKRKKQEIREVKYINEEEILKDLRINTPKDIYLYLLNHSEIKKLDIKKQEQEAFKIFLLLCINKKHPLVKSDDFNNAKIRRVSWH